jgi:hypothetical protein
VRLRLNCAANPRCVKIAAGNRTHLHPRRGRVSFEHDVLPLAR